MGVTSSEATITARVALNQTCTFRLQIDVKHLRGRISTFAGRVTQIPYGIPNCTRYPQQAERGVGGVVSCLEIDCVFPVIEVSVEGKDDTSSKIAADLPSTTTVHYTPSQPNAQNTTSAHENLQSHPLVTRSCFRRSNACRHSSLDSQS
jgi:hypothetical protein